MGQATRDDTLAPSPDDIVGTSVVVHESEPDKSLQATITSMNTTMRAGMERRDPGIENILLESPRANKDAAYFALKEYIVKRSHNPLVKLIFRAVLDGAKPKYEKVGQKHVFHFHDADGGYLNSYNVTLIEL